jgi:predicted ATP-binding protein involved in virulence
MFSFIVAAQSPRPPTSAKRENVIILKDGEAFMPPIHTCGALSSDVLNFVFGAPSRPPGVSHALEDYFQLFEKGREESEEALGLREILSQWLGRGGILDKADILIRKNKLKAPNSAADKPR